MNQEIVHLSLFGMHEDRAASIARVIRCMRAGDQERRGAHAMAEAGRRNQLQWDARILGTGHDAPPCRREYKHSQSPKPDMEAVGDGTIFGPMRPGI